MKDYLLAIDQGTTSSRAIVFDTAGGIVSQAQQEFPQLYPAGGWVEHDPEAIWKSVIETSRQAMEEAESAGVGRVAAIGITNQRETVVTWNRETGEPIYNAIVWQDRRTADVCRRLSEEGHGEAVHSKTGLLLDPYFSATKIAWILENVAGAKHLADERKLAFGTVDTFLLWRLTGGRVHATDATNASRTSLYNIIDQQWDESLLALFGVPASVLPEVRDSACDYGETLTELFGRAIPIRGIAGDQQAAAIGQCCFDEGAVKSTYGTGCFVLTDTGDRPVRSDRRLLTTVAYRLDGRTTYALEGSIFIAGAAVQWLRDGLGVIENAAETESLARSLEGNGGVYMVPAFTGLGAPYWNPDVRGAIFGLDLSTGPAELARAALESVCYQTHDLLHAMEDDGVALTSLRVDGGMVANDWLCQFLADVLNLPVDRPRIMETTALGAAFLAGLGAGIYGSTDDLISTWRLERRFEPHICSDERKQLLAGWHDAVRRVLTSQQ